MFTTIGKEIGNHYRRGQWSGQGEEDDVTHGYQDDYRIARIADAIASNGGSVGFPMP